MEPRRAALESGGFPRQVSATTLEETQMSVSSSAGTVETDSGGSRGGNAENSGLRKIVAASMVGTVVEWYEFFLYATAASLVFGKFFFPNAGNAARRHHRRLPHLRGRLHRPPPRRHRLRPDRRQAGPQAHAAGDDHPRRRRHVPDGLPARLRQHRLLGAGAAGGPALHPGLRRRRRMGRRGAARGRAQPEQVPRILVELAAGGRAGGQPARHARAAHDVVDPPVRPVPGLGLAGGVLALRRHRVRSATTSAPT